MIELSRTVRFCINPAAAKRFDAPAPEIAGIPRHNTFAGWPSMVGIGAYYELVVRCRGEVDPVTGYMMNISQIDQAVRELGIPMIETAVFRSSAQSSAESVLRDLLHTLQPALNGTIISIQWRLSPYYSIAMSADSTDRVSITQQFEFSASHRLHVDAMSDQENRKVFGKCNNANGHGHNYRIEPTVSVPLRDSSSAALQPMFTLADLERIVDQIVLQRFDHTHLNSDTVEFATLNPSVENIAKVCFDLLRTPISAAGGTLQRVTVWETEKTSSTYSAG